MNILNIFKKKEAKKSNNIFTLKYQVYEDIKNYFKSIGYGEAKVIIDNLENHRKLALEFKLSNYLNIVIYTDDIIRSDYYGVNIRLYGKRYNIPGRDLLLQLDVEEYLNTNQIVITVNDCKITYNELTEILKT